MQEDTKQIVKQLCLPVSQASFCHSHKQWPAQAPLQQPMLPSALPKTSVYSNTQHLASIDLHLVQLQHSWEQSFRARNAP